VGAHVASHGREQRVHADPLIRWATDQCLSDRLAASLGRGKDIAGALALDLLDTAELVDHRVGQPALPQLADAFSRRLAQCGAPLRGQLQSPALERGEAISLNQQRPPERRDGVKDVEVTVSEMGNQGTDGHRGRTPGLVAAPQAARCTQLQHRVQVELSFLLGQPYPVFPNRAQRAGVSRVHAHVLAYVSQ
jgi:hypothetical protein